ncbi:MAG: hypothetical protein AAF957_05505 [Planctomycetota bacterium]
MARTLGIVERAAGRGRTRGVALAVDAARRGPGTPVPRTVVVGLLEAPRSDSVDTCPIDGAAMDAGMMLARSFRCGCEGHHFPRADDGSNVAEERLLGMVEALEDPLLVLGCRSRPVAGGAILPGRTTRGVVSSLVGPLWIQRGTWRPPDRIVAALSEFHRDRRVFDLALDLALTLGARLDVVHCRETAGVRPDSITRADLDLLCDVARERYEQESRPASDVGLLELAGPARVALAPHLEAADVSVLGRGCRLGVGHVLHDQLLFRAGPLVIVP